MRKIQLVLLAYTAITVSYGQTPPKLKVLISVDMEGVGGVVSSDQLMPGHFEYDRFRNFTTQEVLAAIEGARAAGATEFVVSDAHGNDQNLLIEQFPADVRIVRGDPHHLGMMGGLDGTFDAVIFIGYHASTHNSNGVRAHTFSSGSLTRVALNGTPVSEGVWNAAIAGQFGIPVILISGDDAAVAEIRASIGDVAAVETKKSLSFHAAEVRTPEAVQKLVREKASAAVRDIDARRPYRVTAPVTVDLSFKAVTVAEALSYLQRVFTRTDSHSVRFTAKDMAEASDIIDFIFMYRADLQP